MNDKRNKNSIYHFSAPVTIVSGGTSKQTD